MNFCFVLRWVQWKIGDLILPIRAFVVLLIQGENNSLGRFIPTVTGLQVVINENPGGAVPLGIARFQIKRTFSPGCQ
jgi:hypothetical protein